MTQKKKHLRKKSHKKEKQEKKEQEPSNNGKAAEVSKKLDQTISKSSKSKVDKMS